MHLGPLGPIPAQDYPSRIIVIEDEEDRAGRFVLRPYRVRLSQFPFPLTAINAAIMKDWCEVQWPSKWYRRGWSFDERTDSFEFKTPEQRFHFVIRWRGFDMAKERTKA